MGMHMVWNSRKLLVQCKRRLSRGENGVGLEIGKAPFCKT